MMRQLFRGVRIWEGTRRRLVSIVMLIVILASLICLLGACSNTNPIADFSGASEFKLIASDGAKSGYFGRAVAISGDTIVVGAEDNTIGANNNQGSAYVFVKSGTTWTQQAQLIASDGAEDDYFGGAVAISGNTIVVGAGSNTIGANNNQGSAYVFVKSGTTWTQQAQLIASDGAKSDYFGGAVAISGDTIVVGAEDNTIGANNNQGSAYVFVKSGTTWTQQAQLIASDGAKSDYFGGAVAISGDTIVVGAEDNTIGANNNQGSAYVFVKSGTTWTQQAQLIASDGAKSDYFGGAVAIDGNTIVVGAEHNTIGANIYQGSAYVFVKSGTTWTQQAQLIASDGAESDYFGGAVAIDGNTIVVGAEHNTIGANIYQGSAYVFVKSGTTWTQQAQLIASDGAEDVYFGIAVAISGDTIVVGAEDNTIGANGSAYVYLASRGRPWA